MGPAFGQEGRKVPVSFVPPPLENATYSLGIYDAKSGKLVRRLQEVAPESAFTVGLNGLITSWDGKGDDGKAVAPGHYAARGYAVGALRVEGKQILGNDWASDDEDLRIFDILAIALVPEDNGLAILALKGGGEEVVARYGDAKTELLWHKTSRSLVPDAGSITPHPCSLLAQENELLATVQDRKAAFRISDGSEITPIPLAAPSTDTVTSSTGRDGTVWRIEDGILSQHSAQGDRLRSLASKDEDAVPVAVVASKNADRLYLLEAMDNATWQRVRGLAWKETIREGDHAVSTWDTFFERALHITGVPPGIDPAAPTVVDVTLVENPLAPAKAAHIKLQAIHDSKGSYLAAVDGLRLRQISQRNHLQKVRLAKSKTANVLTFYQSDGPAWDEFSIEGAKNIMAFDAGEIEMSVEGEKTHSEKPAEPPDL